jgi:hypothetical protein
VPQAASAALPLVAVRDLARRLLAREIYLNETSRVVSFVRDGTRINVYYTTATVGTCLDHPTQGKTQLFRRGVTLEGLEQIFLNPRVHTGRGYKRRRDMPDPLIPTGRPAAVAGAGGGR